VTTKRLPALCTTGDVAAALGWNAKTIRRHCVSLTAWKAAVAADPEVRFKTIPSLRFGSGPASQFKIPRWWVEEFKAATSTPPEPA